MTRKDYIAIAAALKAAAMTRPHVISAAGNVCHVSREDQLTWYACVNAISDCLTDENARFDQSRFFDGCGVPS